MKFYTQQHQFYCGIDLHARSMYVCILDSNGQVVFHKDLKTSPDVFLKAITPFLDDIVIGVECMFAWYWVSDFCHEKKLTFILGHALYMKAIHGGKPASKTVQDAINRFLQQLQINILNPSQSAGRKYDTLK